MNFKLPAGMRVVEISRPGGPETLRLARRPRPRPQADEVLIQVAYAGVNGPDLLQRAGRYPPPPGASDLPGLEVAGTVVAIGPEASRWQVGARVCALTNGGGYGEYCAVKESHCLPVPRGLGLEEAAALPETFFTVWSNIFMGAGLRAGEIFLVHGAAGGIGTTAIMLAKAFGATVYATDTPAARLQACREMGADRVIDYQVEDFVDVVRTEAGGADVILDIVGGDYIRRNFKAARHDGRIVQLAFNQGSKVEIDLMPIMLKRLLYTGSTLRSRRDSFKAEVAAQLHQQVWPKIEAGEIRPRIHKVFPLEQAAAAHELMHRAAHVGKILLRCRP